MKHLCACIFLVLGFVMIWPLAAAHSAENTRTAYDFSFHQLMGGEDLPLAQFKGKVILVVNTASKCGFTPQYDGLEKLYETYQGRGLVIVGVPSNNFGGQEPGTSEQIAGFCKLNSGVSFPMAAKEDVVGDHAHPFYQWAREKFGYIGAPKWNFHKYLIGRDGRLVDYFHSTTAPDNSDLVEAIEKLLGENAE